MSAEIDVVVEDRDALTEPLVVVGIPTLGVVGTITAQYLVDQLEMPQVGGVYSDRFPPVGRVSEGRSSFPVRLHALETSCGLDLVCEHLVVAVTEFMPGPGSMYPLAEGLTRWAQQVDASLVVVPDGLLVRGEESDAIRGVAAQETTFRLFDKLAVEPMDGGVLMGFSAATIANGTRHDVDTVSLLAESAPDRPDARAASRLVEILDQMVPEISIETAPLLEQAEEIERQTQRLREQVEEQIEHQGPEVGFDQMYQ